MNKEQAKIVVLEQSLEQAILTIEFLDNCLRNPKKYRYEYPDQIQKDLEEFKKLIAPSTYCLHSMNVLGCKGCETRNKKWQQREEALEALKPTPIYKIKCTGCGLTIDSKYPQSNDDLCGFCMDSEDFK